MRKLTKLKTSNNRNQAPVNMGMNNQVGYGMPMQPQMNNMYMNNPQMGMNMGYPQQQQQQYNNYPQANPYANPNVGYGIQQPNFNNYNANAPQQNKVGNNQRGSALDFF